MRDFASQLHFIDTMKTATLPSIRVAPEFRATVESVLNETETLSEFVVSAVRETVSRRRNQAEFLARGIRSLETAKQANSLVDADAVVDKLRLRLADAKERASKVNKNKSGTGSSRPARRKSICCACTIFCSSES